MNNDFVCPRCEHRTSYRNDMKKHLYRKFMCKANKYLVLTDEIRELVLRDHIYHPPPVEPNNTQLTQMSQENRRNIPKKIKDLVWSNQMSLLRIYDNQNVGF